MVGSMQQRKNLNICAILLWYFDHVAKLGLGRNFEVNVLKVA
jgi:hypothetical protein